MHLYDVGSEKASNKLPTITTSNAIPCARPMEVVPPEIPAEMLVKNSRNISQNVQCEKLIANVFNNTWLIFLFVSQHLKSLLSWLTKDVSEHQQHHTVRMPTIVPARRWCIQLMWVVKRHLRNSQQSPPAVPPPVEDLLVPKVSIPPDGSSSFRDISRDAVEKLLKHLSECLTRTLSLGNC